MEECYYCGMKYHPMPVFTLMVGASATHEDCRRKPARINVCHLRVTDAGELDQNWTECFDKAAADGFEYRRDLTPTR